VTRPRVFVTRRIAEVALQRLAAAAEVDVWEQPSAPPPERVRERVSSCAGLLCLLTERVDAQLLDAAPGLKVVSNMAVGVDNVDVAACTARKIPVGHTPGVLTEATAELTFALLLAAARRVVEGEAFVRAGKWKAWDPSLLLGKQLHGATLGIAGYGGIGRAVAARARSFGMRVLAFNRSRFGDEGVQQVDRETLLRESDFLSVHLALTPQTRHWLGAAELALMKDDAVLINTARGGVIDQAALVAALKAGRPAFAALDVLETEPPVADEPILRAPNVVLLPHLGSATKETRTRMALLAADNVVAVLEGRRPPRVVNPEVL
jgi:glyoxylate reductase